MPVRRVEIARDRRQIVGRAELAQDEGVSIPSSLGFSVVERAVFTERAAQRAQQIGREADRRAEAVVVER